MADGQLRLLLQSDWTVFDRLAARSEPDRRRILRSHRDVPFRGDEGYDEEETSLRGDLDAALDRLSLIELAIEARLLDQSDLHGHNSLSKLFGSSAFARYVNSYLFLGVRFIASRMLGPAGYQSAPLTPERPADGRGALNRDSAETRTFEINELPLPLPAPPPLEPEQDIEHTIVHWLDFQDGDDDILAALRFIDNYGEQDPQRKDIEGGSAVREGMECGWKEDFERWLRGLGGHSER